jgi:hypothetical protein
MGTIITKDKVDLTETMAVEVGKRTQRGRSLEATLAISPLDL